MGLQNCSCVKEMFHKYEGDFFQMERDGEYQEYKKYKVPRGLELQWIEELKDDLIKILLNCTNHKRIAETFALYGHYAVQTKDEKMFEFMLRYVFEHNKDWDTNTTFRNINVMLSSICILKNQNIKNEIVNKCILSLKDILDNGIRISDDYKEKGKMPEYLSTERISANIQGTIKY